MMERVGEVEADPHSRKLLLASPTISQLHNADAICVGFAGRRIVTERGCNCHLHRPGVDELASGT
jgi:hypothetical protein